MNKEQIKILISAYTDGELSQEDRARAEELILNDPFARQYYKELSQLSTTLKSWKDDPLSPDLAGKIQHALLEEKIHEENLKMRPSTFKIPVGGGLAVSFAVLLIVSIVALRPGGIFQSSYYPAYKTERRYKTDYPAKTQNEQFHQGGYEPYYLDSRHAVSKEGFASIALKREVIAGNKPADGSFAVSETGKYKSSQLREKNAEPFNENAYPSSDLDDKNFRGSGLAGPTQNERGAVAIDRAATKSRELPAEQEKHLAHSRVKGELSYHPADEVQASRRQAYYRDDIVYSRYPQSYNREEYERIYENYFVSVQHNPLSTFSIDVDTASYSNVRRFLGNQQMPPVDAVRIEEMINYFSYDYPKPGWGQPFSITTDGAPAPWNPDHYLVRIGLQGDTPAQKQIPPSNLVFLIDVSGSMNQPDKLPLLKESFKALASQLRDDERVAIVVYSGSARVWLDSTLGSQKKTILRAIDSLQAGGSTAGEAGLRLAYDIAESHFMKRGNNRVILASDGDFNVGLSSDHELVQLIKQQRNKNIFLSILGFGNGNLKDAKMEKIANHGNGAYYYIDSVDEGRKVLVDELGSTLLTIAKDVKIQVEFNPQYVQGYRLIGYENRLLADRDFNNDRVDAGELGAGHSVTALYEIAPNTHYRTQGGVDSLKYQKSSFLSSPELMTVKLRYKPPHGRHSKLMKKTLKVNALQTRVQGDLAFAASVAEFGMLLRNSPEKGLASYAQVISQASRSLGKDPFGHRREFINMVEQAQGLDHRFPTQPVVEPYGVQQYGYPGQQPRRGFKGQ